MNEKRKEFTAYLESCAGSCREQIKKLSADGREDEAVFAKIKLNVYDIFKTVFNALGDEEKFLAKLSFHFFNRIPDMIDIFFIV